MSTSAAIFPTSVALRRHRRTLPPIPAIPTATRPAFFPSTSLCSRRTVPLISAQNPIASAMAEAAAATEGNTKVLVFDGEEELAASIADYTAALSEKYVSERGAFTVVLSGGSLIQALRKLLEPPYMDSVDWAKWHVFWVDERVVPKDHADSNYKLANDGFLCKVPIPSGQVYAINDTLSADGAADDYETCLKHLVSRGVLQVSKATAATAGFPQFDLMLLGMGPDGHVASLFPGHPLLGENSRWVASINDSPKPPPERITFTFPVINSSANVALVVTGEGKASAVHKALGGSDHISSQVQVLPVEMVSLHDGGELTWFADKAAASKLQGKASALL